MSKKTSPPLSPKSPVKAGAGPLAGRVRPDGTGQLVVELQRLTGCGGVAICRALYNAGFPADLPSETAALDRGGPRMTERVVLSKGETPITHHLVALAHEGKVVAHASLVWWPEFNVIDVRFKSRENSRSAQIFVRDHIISSRNKLKELTGKGAVVRGIAMTGSPRYLQLKRNDAVALTKGYPTGSAPYAPIETKDWPKHSLRMLVADLANIHNIIGWRPFNVEKDPKPLKRDLAPFYLIKPVKPVTRAFLKQVLYYPRETPNAAHRA